MNLDKPITVKAVFPGCLTNPSVQLVDPKLDLVTVKFYVTPLSKGSMDSKVYLEQDGISIAEIELPTKVIDHWFAKLITLSGAAISGIPASISYVMGAPTDLITNTSLFPLYAITGVLVAGGIASIIIRSRTQYRDKSSTVGI